MSAINEKYIKGPFVADFHGGIVWGPDNFHFADVRGWGELGYKGDGAKTQDANLQFMVDALNEKASGELAELKKEVEWLTFYRREVYQCLGSGVDDVNKELRDAYVREKGIGGVPEKLRKEYLDYEADHGRG